MEILRGHAIQPTPQRLAALQFIQESHAQPHFIDEGMGQICGVPWEAIHVQPGKDLADFEVREIQVVRGASIEGDNSLFFPRM